MADMQNKDKDFLERRRQLLKLGAAGVPMVLTLKASASQPVHSALDCAFVIPSSMNILVNHNGKAWVGNGSIREQNGKLHKDDIEDFKDNADYVFGNGSAPVQYRPDECEEEDDCGSGDDDDDWRDDDNYWCSSSSGDDDDDNGKKKKKDDDDDDDDDDGGSSDWTDCGFNFYRISSNTTITPSDYLSNNGTWQLSGANGLYLALAGEYLDSNGNDGGFPGISCLLSILNYLDM